MLAGRVLRIEQIASGQCVDFNAFNPHDYPEFLHRGRMRTVQDFNPSTGCFHLVGPARCGHRGGNPHTRAHEQFERVAPRHAQWLTATLSPTLERTSK